MFCYLCKTCFNNLLFNHKASKIWFWLNPEKVGFLSSPHLWCELLLNTWPLSSGPFCCRMTSLWPTWPCSTGSSSRYKPKIISIWIVNVVVVLLPGWPARTGTGWAGHPPLHCTPLSLRLHRQVSFLLNFLLERHTNAGVFFIKNFKIKTEKRQGNR